MDPFYKILAIFPQDSGIRQRISYGGVPVRRGNQQDRAVSRRPAALKLMGIGDRNAIASQRIVIHFGFRGLLDTVASAR